jgi:hypothetical protein
MGRRLRNLTPLAAARRSAVALAPALLLAGCFGTKTPAGHAAEWARVIAGRQGLTINTVNCSPRGAASWTCAGRLKSGRAFLQRLSDRSRRSHGHMRGASAQAGTMNGAAASGARAAETVLKLLRVR